MTEPREADLTKIIAHIAVLPKGRRLIALAGPPGAGKSTISQSLLQRLPDAVLVPMDGFHLDDRLLVADGLRAVKGAPQTFDARGFVTMIQRLRAGGEVIYPLFDRDREIAIAGAGRVRATDETILIEGNYLLLNQSPWDQLSPLWDLSIMLTEPMGELERRLTARWQGYGKTPAEIAAHLDNDLANARLVSGQSLPADLTISGETP